MNVRTSRMDESYETTEKTPKSVEKEARPTT